MLFLILKIPPEIIYMTTKFGIRDHATLDRWTQLWTVFVFVFEILFWRLWTTEDAICINYNSNSNTVGPEGLLSRASKKKYKRGCIQEIFFALPVIIYNRYNIIMIVDIFFLKWYFCGSWWKVYLWRILDCKKNYVIISFAMIKSQNLQTKETFLICYCKIKTRFLE